VSVSPLSLIVAAAVAWLTIGALGLVQPRNLRIVRLLFPTGGALALALAAVAFVALARPPEAFVLPLGLPDLPFHLRIDALSAFFLVLLGSASAAISLFSS